MEFFDIIFRTLVSALTLFILTKLMGRKQIGQLNIFDYIVGITIGNIAGEMTVNQELDYWICIVAMIVFALIDIFISFITMKSIKLRRFVIGSPIVLIERGRIIEKGLFKARFDINELLQECRSNGYFNINEIEYALMESNGRVSFLPKAKYKPLSPSDMKLKVDKVGLCANLVIDGNIMENNLKNINKDREWLLNRLKKEKIEDYSQILLLACDVKEKFFIYYKNKELKNSMTLE